MSNHRTGLGRIAGEFALIVLGVLTALAVEGWREANGERATAMSYLEQLEIDLSYNEEHLESVALGVEQRLGHVRAALEVLAGEHTNVGAAERLTSLYVATRGGTPSLAGATFQDMIATGSLRFIRDDELRNQIVAYHREADRWAVANFELINENRVPYRNAVRSTIPLRLQEEIVGACDFSDAPLTCAPELEGQEARAVLVSLEQEEGLSRMLTLWASSLRTARSSLGRLIEPTRDLRDRVRAALEAQ